MTSTSCLMLLRFRFHHHHNHNYLPSENNILFHSSVSNLNTYNINSSKTTANSNSPPPIFATQGIQKKKKKTKRHHHSRLRSSSLGAAAFIISSSFSEMDASPAQSLYPLHRCKTIHLVRHAQGIHNVAGEKDHSAYLSPELFDAKLTPLGWQQVDNLRKHVNSTGLSKRVELVITSPLLRTMQTAVGVFGGEGYTDGVDVLPLMAANAGNSNRPAISSLNCPQFMAVEGCREHLGVHWCDKRRSISEYKPFFPAIDFSLIENDADILWTPDIREADEELAARGMDFLNWLWTRKEKEIAVVSHSGFLIHTLNAFGNDCHPTIKGEICRPFNNCELRSIVIVDRSMMGSDSSKTDYPGKIPSGPDVPSDNGIFKQ